MISFPFILYTITNLVDLVTTHTKQLICIKSNSNSQFLSFSLSREDSTIGYQFMYKKDDATSPAKNGNAVIIQIAFSYDTLVESSELIDESESDMEDCSDDNQSNELSNKNFDSSKNKSKNTDNISNNNDNSSNEEPYNKLHGINIDGYFSSAVDIFGIKEEINAVKIEFEKQKAIELFKEGKFGKMTKRRIHSG